MKFIQIPFWIIGFVLLVGCHTSPALPLLQGTQISQTEAFLLEPTPSLPATSVSPTPLLQASKASQTEAILPESTQSLPAADITPTPLANIFHIQTYCPSEKLGIRELPELPGGTLVFSAENKLSGNNILSPEPGKNSMISFWHPQSDSISTYNLVEGQEVYYYAESPNKEKLAFTEGKTATISFNLFILDHQGKELGRIVVPDDWTFSYWRNNDQLLLQHFKAKGKFELIAINLSDKKQETLATNFPDIYLNELFWNWGSQILFNRESTLALYPVRQYDPDQLLTVLWNVKENKEVAKIVGSGWARWSPDGSRFMLGSVDICGKIEA